MGRISTERANRIYYEAKKLKASMTEEDKAKRKEAQRYAPSGTSGRSAETTSTAPSSSPKANAKYAPMDAADNQYAQALAAFNPGGTFVPRAAQEKIAARKAANRSRYMDALDTSTRAGVAAAGSGTVRPVMNTDETVAVRNEWAKKAAQYEADRQSAGREFRAARGTNEYRDRVGSFDRSTIPYGANNTGRIRYALDDSFRNELDTFNQRQGLLDSTYENLKYLNDFEKNDLANLVAQGDYDRANEYLDHLQPELNARMQGNVSAANKKLAEEQPVAGVLANIVGTREAGMALLPTIQGAINEEMGVYKPVDTNGSAFRAAHLLRDTEEGIGNAAYNAAGGGTKGEIARTLAQAGLSAAQNASMLPMGGTAPLVFMGSMAAGQSALDTLENGGTAQDALKVAAATGIIEAATEKIGIDNFFRISRLGSKGIKDFLKGAKQYKLLANDIGSFSKALGSQMAAEGVEEMIAEVADNLADTAIRGDNGQYAQLVQTYMANGMSEEQAKARAFTDMYIDNVAKAGITGALAGGMLGVGGATIGTFQTSTRNRELIRNFEDVGNELQNLKITPEQLISAVQQSGSKDAQDFARELSQKLALGEEVTTAEMGRLHLLSNNYITSKDYEAVQKAAIAEEAEARNAGGNVRESEQNLRGIEAAAGVRQNAGNAAEVQQGEPLQRSQNQPAEAQNVTNAQTGTIDVASKATNTESIESTAGQVTGEAPSVQAPQTTENAPKEARQPTTYEQGAQVQTPQGEGTVVMTADNTVAVRLANGTTEIFKTADLSSAQANANENTALPQSSAAQTATGNTAANTEANEANVGERSEAAAQTKTVAETSWENIQKIVQTKAKGGLSQKDEYTMNSAGRRAFDRIGRALGVEIHFVDRIVNEEGEANGLYQNGHIFIARNAENPYHVVLAHEITHHFEKTAPDVYEKFKSAALKMNPGLVEKYMAMWGYGEAVAEFEVTADFAGELLEKESTVKRVIKEDISAARGFHRAMNAVFDKVRGDDTKGLTEEERKLDAQLDAARDMWRRCLRETRDEKAEGGESKGQFSRNPNFASEINDWNRNGRADDEVFILGSTGDVLQGLGAIESDIFIRSEKIKEIFREHPEMTLREIKRIPEVLDDPVLILKSRNAWRGNQPNTRIVIFGAIKATNNLPVMDILDILPVENRFVIEDMQKVTSAYTKTNKPVNFIRRSDILYADKKRTIPLLRSIGFQMPIELQQSGSVGNISYVDRSVNIVGKLFSDVVKEGEGVKGQFSRKGTNIVNPRNGLPYNGDKSYRAVFEGENVISEYANYAMFADNPNSILDAYGEDFYSVRHDLLTPIDDLKPKIAKAWDKAVEQGLVPSALSHLEELDGAAVAEEFDPADIVDSAAAWDDPDLITWAFDQGVFDDVQGVKTQDGAVAWDAAIEREADYAETEDVIGLDAPQMSRKLSPEQRKLDEDYMAAVERGDMETAQRMVDEAAKAAGYTIKAYHGTPNGTFHVFRDWSYFTEDRDYADVYQNQGASSNGYKQTADNPKTYGVYLKPKNAFDTRISRDRKIFQNEFYRQWGNGAPLSERGLPDWTDGDDLIEFFDEEGYDYDAFYLDEGGTGGYGDEVHDRGVSIVIKDSAQIKSADPVTYDDNGEVIPLTERFNEKKNDIRFSMKKPVEVTDRLIAWHNISSSNIDGAIELGGFAMPSFAVKPADQAHEGYGDISVIARRESIDPERSKDQSIFAGDAWTPVFPETGIKINERAARAAENRVRALLEAAGMTGYYSLALDADNLADQIKRWGSFAEAYGNNRELKLAFLQDKGRAVAIPKKDKSYSRLADIPTLRRVARTVDINDRSDIMKYEPAVRKLVRDYYIKRFGETVANRLHPEDKALSFSDMDNVIYGAQQLMDSGETKETDTARLDKRLENAMRAKKTQTEYRAWLNDLSKDFVERRGVRNNKELFTPSGNRRGFDALYDDYTLANIVRAMRSQPKQGRSAFLSGAGSVKGAALSEFKSIEDVRAARGRLTSELDERGKRAYNEFNAAVEQVAKVFDPDIFDGAAALADVLSNAKTKPAIERYLKREYSYLQSQNGVNISTLASDIYDLIPLANALPQEYFESKVYRGFPFSEAAAVVVPDTLPKETQQKLRDLDANVVTYKAGDQADRLAKVNSVEGAKFSRKGQDAAMRRANRLARENARLKGQFKLTKGVKLRESDIRKVTRELLKDYEIIDFDKDELERHIRAMAEAAQAADESNADKTWDSIRNVARGLSRYVGRAAFARYADADEEYDADLVRETYEDIRRHLGRQRVLSPWFKDPWVENESPQRKEMRDYYRRKLFGVLTLTSDKSVDKGPLGDIGKLYEELTETFGEAYFPSDVTNDEDQIMHIADVLDDLKDTLTRIGERTPMTVAEDVEQSSRDETRRAAYEDEVYGELYARLEEDILNRIAEVRREKPTFADKKKAEQYAAVEAAIEQTQSKAEAAEIANRIEDARKYRERIAKLEARLNKLKEENKGLKGEARQTQKDIREADTYYRQAAQEALREAKAQKREALQELKDKYKAKTAEARERQNARELRRKIEKYTKDLYKTLAKPTNEKHINEDVRPAAALLISLINQESNFETDPATGKRVSRGGATRKAQLAGVGLDIDLPNILTKRTEAARKMKKAAEQIFAGEDNYLLVYDPELMENLAIMEDWSDKPLATMSSAELQVVWDAVRGVEHMITQSRKVFNEGRQWEVGTLASGLVRDVDLNNPRRTIKYGAAASVDKLLNIDQLPPQAFFHRFGEGGDRLFRMLRRSQDKYVRIIADIQARTAEVIKDIDIDKLNKDIATYKVKGGDVTLSRAQVLLLYASIKREQAAGHILGGGIKAKPLKGKGLFETKQLLPVEVTQEDLDNMFKEAKLTEAEKKAADGLVNIMSTVLAEYGNEASLRTYGYAKFREGWYVPIETDPTSNKTDNNDPLFKQFTAAASIAGRGFAKQTKEGAKNAIMVGSLFDVYAKHVNDMAMYAAYVETLENMRRVRNFKFEDGTKTQNYIEALLTQAGVAYWDKLINDINGGERLKNDDFSFDRFVGAYKAAAVSANIRVILQQPTSIIRAAAEINPAYLIAAMRKIPKRHEWERVKKNSAIAQWKDWGYFDINTGRQMRDVVLGTDSLFEKFKQAGMRPMSGADSFAWTLLYHACEDEAKAKGLRPGSAAFDSFVASRFSDVIDKTQVVDGVLQRSQIMRSTNAVTKMATSFMAEPTKTYNMFLSAVWDWRHAKSKTEKQAARKKLGFTAAALVVSFLVNAAAQSLIDALRDDDRDKEFLDKFWDAYLGRPKEDDKNKAVTVMGGNLWANFNPVTYIPFFKDIVSLVQGYSTKRMDMESIGRVIDAAEQALAASKGEGKQTAFARAFALASEVSRVFGLPLANIKRDSVAVLNTIAQEKKDYDMMYKVDRAFYKLDKNVSRYVDIMLKAHDSGDTETEKRITDDLHAAGVDDKKIKGAADKIRQKQQNVDSVTEIKDRYRTYSEAASYNKLESYAKGTSAYRQANAKERSKYETLLNDALANNSDAQGRHEKAREIGVSDNQYMELLIAADVADRTLQKSRDGSKNESQGNGSVTQDEYIAALEMTRLSRTQKREAFALKYPKSKTGNPYA